MPKSKKHYPKKSIPNSSIPLNDTEGLGYTWLCRFAHLLQELSREYYSDPEHMEAKLKQRLEQMGFKVEDGRLFGAVDGDGNIVPTSRLEEA